MTVDYGTNTLGLTAKEAEAYVAAVGGKPKSILGGGWSGGGSTPAETRAAKKAWAGCGSAFKPGRYAIQVSAQSAAQARVLQRLRDLKDRRPAVELSLHERIEKLNREVSQLMRRMSA